MSTILPVPEQTCPLHFIHPDHPIGDVHPYYEDGVYYLNYLYDPGTWKVAQLRSTDLLNWEWKPLTHAPAANGQSLPNYFVLDVLRDPHVGLYRTYYGLEGTRTSVSRDLVHWDFGSPHLAMPDSPSLYDRQSDPAVFWNEDEEKYWMVQTLRKKNLPVSQAGAIGFATSPDLQHWEYQGELYFPGDRGDPECPTMFRMGNHWYLLASYSDGRVGKPSYRISSSPRGPWHQPFPDSLDGEHLCAAESCYDGKQRLLFGWIPLRFSNTGKQHWGGHLSLPREIYSLSDDRLGTRLERSVAERIRGAKIGPGNIDWRPVAGQVTPARRSQGVFFLEKSQCITFEGTDHAIDLEMSFIPKSRKTQMVLSFEDGPESISAKVQVDFLNQRLSVQAASGENLCSIGIAWDGEESHFLRIVCEADILECFLDDLYSLAARLPDRISHSTVAVSNREGVVQLETIEVYRLRGVHP